jgi:hypothetical protein
MRSLIGFFVADIFKKHTDSHTETHLHLLLLEGV